MTTSTPLWVPLAVAIVGVAGTLGATVFSQFWSRKMDERRWRREREAENVRWTRERDERAAQWEREDRARWLADRRDGYAASLADYHTLTKAIDRVYREVKRRNSRASDDELSELAELEANWERSCNSLRLIAPKKVMKAIWMLYGVIEEQIEVLEEGELKPKKVLARVNDYLTVYKAMQEDLGLSDGTYASE
ncbi:hypothetical protein ACIP95_21870 [Micromonospora parva]|uniref:hypothetical protein n=1 Tax=Micromonospora parva TaxID=1464048 RepID=UPI0033EE694C